MPRETEGPMDECDPPGDCLWRATGYDPARKQYNLLLGLVRAPRRDIALTIAQHKFGPYYQDIQIRGEPIDDLPDPPKARREGG